MSDHGFFLGQTLNDVEILAFKGEGAFSFVYEACHIPSDIHVAVKVLKPNANFEQIREFDNEGQLLVKLSGANHVVNILDSQTADLQVVLAGIGTPMTVTARFHVLELATNCLNQLVAHLDIIPWLERLRLYRNVVLGVHQMHVASIVHRDLKTSNCLLFEKRMRQVVAKVNDLGRSRDLAQTAGAQPHHYQFGRGDPDFAPPEMLWQLGIDEPNSHRQADLYGLGSVLYELTTGQGITAVALFPRVPTIQADLVLPERERRHQYRGRLDEIRSWFESAHTLAIPAIPLPIRNQTLGLLRQLCDPDPMMRLPHVASWKKVLRVTDLNWLLNRVDILIKTLSNAEDQAERLARKKASE